MYGQPNQYGRGPPQRSQPPQQYGAQPQQYGAQPPQYGGYPPAPPGGAPYQDPQLRAYFDAVDRDRSGYIDARELQGALSSAGHNFSIAVAEKLIRMFDKSGRGSINFYDYQELHKFINVMVQGFRSRDTSGDGRLDAGEIGAALQAGGYNLQEQTISFMMRKFDAQRRGSLGLDDYIDLSILIGTAAKVFAFYDQQHTGQVTFDFNNFFVAACSLR